MKREAMMKQKEVVEMVNPEIMGQDSFEMKVEIPLPESYFGRGMVARIETRYNSKAVSSVLAQEKLSELAKQDVETFVNGLQMLSQKSLEEVKRWFEASEAVKKERREKEIPYDWSHKLEEFICTMKESRKVTRKEIEENAEVIEDYENVHAYRWMRGQLRKYDMGYLNNAQIEELKKYVSDL